METNVPTRPGHASGLPVGLIKYSCAFCASSAYLVSPVRSERRVHSSTRVPTSAMLFSVEPLMRGSGLSWMSESGTPLGVSKAMLRLSARETACLSRGSTRLGSETRLLKGPSLSKS